MVVEKQRNEQGAIAIEAVLGITVFLLAMISIMFVSLIVRVEARMQYAADQTAKEISSYYYVVDAVGLTKYIGKSIADSKEIEDLNNAINGIIDFSGDVKNASSMDIKIDTPENAVNTVKEGKETAQQLYASASNMYDQIKVLGEDPIGNLKAVLQLFGQSAAQRFLAPFLCKALLPKYISSGGESADEYLKKYGVVDGVDGLNYDQSCFLFDDGRTIRVVVIFKLNTKSLTFGLIDTDMVFRQVAVTAAWVKPGEGKEVYSIVDAFKNNHSEASSGEQLNSESSGTE